MLTNFLFFVALVAVACVTTRMNARPPRRERVPVRWGRSDDAGRR